MLGIFYHSKNWFMEKTGYLGIDVSKGYADFLLLDGDCQVFEDAFRLQDNKEGRQKLKELIGNWHKGGLEKIYCGVESTGGYENNWYGYLKSNFGEGNVLVCRINPRGVKALSNASLKRTITDAVSAENIASYLVKFPQKLDYGINPVACNETFKEGRQHNVYIKMLVKQKVQLGNQLEKLLYQNFSELMVYCRHGIPIWLLSMLSKYPTAKQVQKAGISRLSAINGISEEKAVAIISKAKEANQDVSNHIGHVITVTAREILHKVSLIKEEKQYLTDLFKDVEEVKLVNSIPGIGIDSAVAIILEIENIERFDTAKKMASFFGVHPTYKQSGDGMWGSYMSKKGRGEIRAILYMATLAAIRYNPLLKQVYARFRAKGMKHYPAAGVVMHKLLRIIYGILKNKTTFNAETDEENQKQAAQKQQQREQKVKEDKKIKTEKKHRFQEATIQAPISRRAEQKLKKQIASQTSD
jgi:transposase